MIFPDQPLNALDEDKLNRANVAINLADAIIQYSSKESFVIGLNGKWGDGKSSFVGLVLDSINKRHKEKFIIVKFNPWYFSGDHQILRQFCITLSSELATQSNNNAAILDVAKKIKRIATIVEPLEGAANVVGITVGVPFLGTFLKSTAQRAKDYASTIEEAIQPSESITELKEEIQTALDDFNRKIIIVVDDVDRLASAEIFDIFKFVKIVADFPNTVYILSYDKEVIAKALNVSYPDSGHRFIEKIIQQEITLPVADAENLAKQFLEGISPILEKTSHSQERLSAIYFRGLVGAFTNLRTVKRTLNLVHFLCGAVKEEINILDMIALTVLQVNSPNSYDFIKNNGSAYLGGKVISDEETKKQYREFIQDKVAWERNLLDQLLPATANGVFNVSYNQETILEWVADSRLCVEEHFKTYFLLSVPPKKVSEKSYLDVMNGPTSKNDYTQIFNQYEQSGILNNLLSGLRARTRKFSKDKIKHAISALLDKADFIKEDNFELYGLHSSDQAFYLALNLLDEIDQDKKKVILEEAIENTTTGIVQLFRLLEYIGANHGFVKSRGQHTPLLEEEKFLTEIEWRALCDDAIIRLQESSAEEITSRSGIPMLCYSLDTLGYEQDMFNMRQKILAAEDGLLRAASSFCGIVRSSSAPHVYHRLLVKDLMFFLKSADQQTLIRDIQDALDQSTNENLKSQIQDALRMYLESVKFDY